MDKLDQGYHISAMQATHVPAWLDHRRACQISFGAR
jgi:hypothetical protein